MHPTEQFMLTGKVAVVTGAARNIGRETAATLAAAGAAVVVADIDDAKGEDAAAELRRANYQAMYVHADVSKPHEVAGLSQAAGRTFGRVDIWINNAKGGEGARQPVADMPLADWQSTLDVCLTGCFLGAKYAIPHMIERGGVIINISSVHALAAYPHDAAYDVAKAGLLALTRSIAADYGQYGIRCNAILPGAVPHRQPGEPLPAWARAVLPRYPIGRVGMPSDIALAVLYLVSDAGSFITGASLVVDGGMTALSPEYFEH